MAVIPTPLPPDSTYTSCYCEENIYLLCKTLLENEELGKLWEPYVVFISNTSKMVALWQQKRARSADAPVVWDYHVILVLRPRNLGARVEVTRGQLCSWVYDYDTLLSMPCPWREYFDLTFPEGLVSDYESWFRVIPGATFVRYFASDRSHMIVSQDNVDEKGSHQEERKVVYYSPPPTYSPICGPGAVQDGVTNNLMTHYVAMVELETTSESRYGVVSDRKAVDIFFAR